MKKALSVTLSIIMVIGFIIGFSIGKITIAKNDLGKEKEPSAYELLQRINNAE